VSGIDSLTVMLEALGLLIPFIGFERLENFGGIRSVYDRADLFKRTRSARRQNLDCSVSQGRRFGWTSDNCSTRGIRRHLVENTIFRPAANHANILDTLSDELLQMAKHHAVFESETLQDGTHIATRALWDGLMSPCAKLINGGRHVPGTQKRLVVRIYKTLKCIFARRGFH